MRDILRGIVAVIFVVLLGGTAVAGAIDPSQYADVKPGGVIAPFVVCGVGAVGFAVLAWAAFGLASGAAADRARSGYAAAKVFVPLITVAGLGTGVITAVAYGEAENLLTAAWSTALVLLAYLLVLRGQRKSVARAMRRLDHPKTS
ncbi:MAG: hypothetical protein HOU81_04705 [Hamadaea sp.]|uniref:hypothetical protein n=1 Tax=Hamadaea sp. TaxID=2024425 RepID=UPI0017E5D19B|nr:hypothetical protein [Hamadaea sp.]NUR70097.1 hypothetical protein [Hamadaea sp.]NUT21451.1 hypothetical protein [Hamadaea sp.]